MTALRKLNMGCGPVQPAGWVNMDTDPQWKAEWRFGPNPGEQYDVIVANHVLQMVPHQDVVETLWEWHRFMARGACLRLLVPDVVGAFSAYHQDVERWFPCDGKTIDEKLCAYLAQAGTTRSFYTLNRLVQVVTEAGFIGWEVCAEGETSCRHEEIVELDSRGGESLIIEAYA